MLDKCIKLCVTYIFINYVRVHHKYIVAPRTRADMSRSHDPTPRKHPLHRNNKTESPFHFSHTGLQRPQIKFKKTQRHGCKNRPAGGRMPHSDLQTRPGAK